MALTDSFTDSASAEWCVFIDSGGQNVGWKVAKIFGARVGRMTAQRVKPAAGMLPDTAPLVPMKAQSPKRLCQHRLVCWRNVEPNPFADDLGQFILAWQLRPQAIQDLFRGQPAIGAMPDKTGLLI